uniref:VbhA domain-containing protein n=1 Tax=Steinernema glaseri TaxID=37863 RepID=A0A1I7Z607_9BILA
MPQENKPLWEQFKDIRGPEEARRLLEDHQLEQQMTVEDLLYLRRFYVHEFPCRPIPDAYGPLRTKPLV